MRNWLLLDGCNVNDLHEYEKLFFDVTRILREPQNIFDLFQLPTKFAAAACTECGRTIPDKLPRFIALPIRSGHRQDWISALEPVIQSINKEVAELPLTQCYLAERVPRIKDLAKVLAMGVPVGAWPGNWDPRELSENLQTAISKQALTRDRFYELADTIRPDASSFSEVIGAAWHVQSTHHRQNFQQIFARAQEPADSWSEFYELVKTFDYTVVKSIETAKIVQVWRQFGNGVGTVERGTDSSSNVPHG
jgi:hypothetical protein